MKTSKASHTSKSGLPSYDDHDLTLFRFILNGIIHVNALYGEEIFHIPDWRVIGEYVYDEDGGRHQAFLSPTRDCHVLGHSIKANERIQIEQSVKYSTSSADRLFELSGLKAVERWIIGDEYGE